MATRKLLDKEKSLQVVSLSQQQIDSIKKYSNQIITLKDFVAAVRKRPTMYIGYKGNQGYIRCIREVLQNAIDEICRKDSCGTTAAVTYYEGNRQTIIEDNGRGIPYGHIIRVFSVQHTGSNYEKKLFDYTSGTNGVGSKVTMALSKMFVVESYVLGEGRRVEFDDGTPWDKGELPIPNKENRQGTMVSFTPSIETLGNITITAEDVLNLIKVLIPVTPLGTSITFKGIKLDGTEIVDRVTNEDGMMGVIIDICEKPMINPIIFREDTGEMKAEVILDWDALAIETGIEESIVSYANYCPTNSALSSHTKGFCAGLKEFFVPYMNNIYLNSANSTKGNKKKKGSGKQLKVIEADIRSGIRAVVDAAVLEPTFTGQSKDVLEVEEIETFVKNLTVRSLEEWSKTNPTQLNKICKYFKEIATIRSSTEDKKVKISKSYKSGITGLPNKFTAPSKEWKELFIVEGDSAGGPCVNNRDVKTQGIITLRGMMKNCFEAKLEECLANPEVAAILMLCGWEQGKNYTADLCKWVKVISAGDADSAGAEINALVLRCVLRFMPALIHAGKFYRAVNPLYYVNRGKGKNKLYFTDKIELVKWIQSQFSKSNVLETVDGKKISPSQLQEILYHNIDYLYELEKIADRYLLKPEILELYLMNRTKSEKEICKILKNKYRFMNPLKFKMPDGTFVRGCQGSVDCVTNTIIFSDKMINESENIIRILDGNLYDTFIINGRPGTIYDLMKIYKEFEPGNLMRLKGLGEQNGSELAETLLLPGDQGGNRTLVQYTMSEAMKEIEEIRRFESNKELLLKDLKVTRLDITD